MMNKTQLVREILAALSDSLGLLDAAKENPARSANPNPATFEHWMRPVTVHAHELLT